MKHTAKYIYATIYLVVLLALTGCSSKLNISAKSDNGVDIEFSTGLGTALVDTIKTVTSSMGGNSKSSGFFSADIIKAALADSDFSNYKVLTPDENSFTVNGSLPSADKQTHATGTLRAADLVICNSNILALKLSPKDLKTFADGLPQDTKNYLDLFMAPVFTGEAMSKNDYKMLIASIYGEKIAAELEQSSITVTLTPPKGKAIKNAALPKNGTSTQTKATFSIPLLEFLTTDKELVYSIKW